MTKKQFVRVVGFLLVLLCMFTFLSDVFENKNNVSSTFKTNAYFALEKDTLDVALIGTSGIDRYWLAPKAYEEQGIASFPFVTDGYPVWLMLPVIKDFVRRHDTLKLVVVDMRAFAASYSGVKYSRYETRTRTLIEALPLFSKVKLDTVNKTLQVVSKEFEDKSRFDLSYYFTFIKHHSRWSEDDFDIYEEIENKTSPYMGAFIHKKLSIRSSAEPLVPYASDERQSLDPLCLETLYELFDYAKEQNLELLFLNTPHAQSERNTKRFNTLCDILDKEGYNYVYYDLDGKIYNFATDFYNAEHANYYGAEKFSATFIEYLKENYDLPDRRGDERYYQWEGTYDKVKSAIASYEAAKNKK